MRVATACFGTDTCSLPMGAMGPPAPLQDRPRDRDITIDGAQDNQGLAVPDVIPSRCWRIVIEGVDYGRLAH